MFTTTNVSATAASAGGVGPVAAAVPPTFQIISASVTGPSSSSSSSSSLSSSATTQGTWRTTPLSSQFIKQPSVVSIINANMNVSSATSAPLNSTGITISSNSNMICIKTTNPHQFHPITTNATGNILIQSPQTVRLVTSSSTPTLTLINNSNVRQMTTPSVPSLSTANFKPGVLIDTPILGRLAPIKLEQQIINPPIVPTSQPVKAETRTPETATEQNNSTEPCIVSNDNSLTNNSQDQEIEIFVNNVVSSFALGCKLNLRKIAMEAANVVYKRDQAMVLMKIRKPYCSANIWSSGKVTVTGTTSEDEAKRGARRVARSIQRLGYKVRFRHYRVVNCLATCSMPWPIDIIKLSRTYPLLVSYEPEIHPGATVRLSEKAVLKVFTTGSVTLTAPSVDDINNAVNEFYPQLYECRKVPR